MTVRAEPGSCLDRLTAVDLPSLWTDGTDWPQDVGALAVLDGRTLFDDAGRFRIEAVRAEVAARLPRAPRLRRVLRVPRRGFGRPLWVDAPAFDLADHVRVAPLPSPGDEAGLLAAVERLRRRPLEPTRPLWEMWLLPGLCGGRVGLYLRAHHALVDAAAGMAIVAVLLDTAQAGAVPPPRPWIPAPEPTPRQLLADDLRRRRHVLGRVIAAAGRRVRGDRRPQSMSAAVVEMVRRPATRTSLNRLVGPDRSFALVRDRLDRMTRIAHARGATVNDVLLTAVTGGLRALLLARGEPVEDLLLRALVPVSLHGERHGLPQGNVLGQITAPLPVGQADPAQTLRLITAATAAQKARVGLRHMPVLRSRALQRVFLGFLARQRMTTLAVSDVPGPREQLFLAGAPLVELFPLVPLTGNMPLGVAALSYAGAFTVGVVADRTACPDVDVFADGLRATLDLLAASS